MNSIKLKKKLRKLPMKLKSYAASMILCLTIGLTGCANNSRKELYSAPLLPTGYLYLVPNTPIQTKEGIYVPHQNEKWVAEFKYQALERENLALVEAIKKIQTERDMK